VNRDKFDAAAERMTKTQRTVLKQFLAGKTDEAIARNLDSIDPSTVRRHIANICRIFDLKNEAGEHFSYRQELIELFAKFSPELVDKQLISGRFTRIHPCPNSKFSIAPSIKLEPTGSQSTDGNGRRTSLFGQIGNVLDEARKLNLRKYSGSGDK
jgi:DNA-binding CsgD family transcriptional regulator